MYTAPFSPLSFTINNRLFSKLWVLTFPFQPQEQTVYLNKEHPRKKYNLAKGGFPATRNIWKMGAD